ncbi:MAG: glycoside hydrolase family 125 protein [Clostridia bacterium]|nr:glycoside hydrolase family 125 protein [Clostridia bacterium]
MTDYSSLLSKTIISVSERLKEKNREDLIPIFSKCYSNTLETTFKILDDKTSFVITGDIHAMWLRDSAAQVHHYLSDAKDNKELADIIESMINRYSIYIRIDPYANAFNENGDDKERGHTEDITFRSPWVWERKYEVDSLCSVIFIAYKFWKATGRTSIFTGDFRNTLKTIIDLWKKEQYHAENSDYTFERPNPWKPSDTLTRGGKAEPVGYTGMTWSAFRPSDDACKYNYLIPSEMYAVVVLGYVQEIAKIIYKDDELYNDASLLANEIDTGINEYGIVETEEFGPIYAYETDGLGNYNLMDDANVPSLLSIPYIGYRDKNDPVYKNTRRFILSKNNPYYYEGKYLCGIGSPHTDVNCVWPISLVMQGLTSDDDEEIEHIIDMLANTHDNTGYMHESINADNPKIYTRKWFAWANSIFSELIIKYAGMENKEE